MDREHCETGGTWSNERVIIFTEYRDTQKYLVDQLTAAGLAKGDRLKTLFGGQDDDEREAIKAAFQADPDLDPVRILWRQTRRQKASTSSGSAIGSCTWRFRGTRID